MTETEITSRNNKKGERTEKGILAMGDGDIGWWHYSLVYLGHHPLQQSIILSQAFAYYDKVPSIR
jgi:hypothetical protein